MSSPTPPSPEATHALFSDRVRRVLSLFESALADVPFPGLDAHSLSETADLVREAAERLQSARRVLVEAETELRARHALLEQQCELGLAYASVLASARPELGEAVRLARGGADESAPMPKRRGRPRKDVSSAGSLLGVVEAEEAEGARAAE